MIFGQTWFTSSSASVANDTKPELIPGSAAPANKLAAFQSSMPSIMAAAHRIFATEADESGAMEIPTYLTETELQIVNLRRHKEAASRYHAAEALAAMGPRAASAVPALLVSLEEDDSIFVRKSAAIALGEIGDRAAEESLRRAASEDENVYVRERAAQALKLLRQ